MYVMPLQSGMDAATTSRWPAAAAAAAAAAQAAAAVQGGLTDVTTELGAETNRPSARKKGLAEWVWTILGRSSSESGFKLRPDEPEGGELQTMLSNSVRCKPRPKTSGDVCLLAESPYRILRAAESGNVEDFLRLYYNDTSRLGTRDLRGRTAAHNAAGRNHVEILKIYHSRSGDVNIQDDAGDTPLHLAVKSDALEAIDLLLTQNANPGLLNNKKQAIIHLAAELNKVAVLRVLARHKAKIDANQGGEHGRTALHLAAIHDHDECARILIFDLDAYPCRPCNNGYYPIHEAAKNAASRTMEELIKWGQSRGCTREQLMSQLDNEGNLPLHSAVHGGDIKAVELCIRSGARISMQQSDLSTPVHLACSQGALDLVKLMFKLQPEEKRVCLASCDVQRMTPLHCAAMFGHSDIVSYLVSEGADMNQLDKENRSPMLLAATRCGWRTVQVLIGLGANIDVTDINARNVLHLVVMNGGLLAPFAESCKLKENEEKLKHLLNEKDNAGCSPLHYASRAGHIRSLKNLIELGACVNPKNNNNESPLHFAARYGRYHSAVQLLNSEKGSFIINETDGNGQTALHIASSEGHLRVVQLLLDRGALLQLDYNGRNPLHLAAMNGYTQTVELLHSVHSQMIDHSDREKNTVLHLATMENKPNSISLLLSMGCRLTYNEKGMSAIDYAIYYKFPEAALAMVTHETRANEVMALRSAKHPCVTLALIAYMPNVFAAVLDRCITKADCKKDSKSFYVKFGFNVFKIPGDHPSPLAALNIKYSFEHYQESKLEIDAQRLIRNDPKYRPSPLCVINEMVGYGRVELLAHPLSQKYLQMKWNNYGKYFHLTHLLLYSVFLTFVTVYSYLLMNLVAHEAASTEDLSVTLKENSTAQASAFGTLKENQKADIMATMTVSAVAILTYTSLCVGREMYNMVQRKWNYLLDAMNLASWLLYITAILMAFPTFMGEFYDIQYSAAAMTVFLAWFQLLLLLQRFDRVGIYVVMFLEILQTLIKVLFVFSILIIAFGMAFYILLSKGNHLSFKDIPMSLMRTFTMMLGEIDFIGTYVEPYYNGNRDGKHLSYPGPVFFILALFMVLMPILLMNLLIGLAVGDIESVRRNAQLKRLAMQVILHTELESKLPAFLLAKVDKMELIEYPNDVKCKVSCIDFILRKWFCNPFNEDTLDIVLETSEEHLMSDVSKMKMRLKEMAIYNEKQHALLRLIVQKMEIRSEADDVDEGVPSEPRLAGARYSPPTPSPSAPRSRAQLRTANSFNRGYNIY